MVAWATFQISSVGPVSEATTTQAIAVVDDETQGRDQVVDGDRRDPQALEFDGPARLDLVDLEERADLVADMPMKSGQIRPLKMSRWMPSRTTALPWIVTRSGPPSKAFSTKIGSDATWSAWV